MPDLLLLSPSRCSACCGTGWIEVPGERGVTRCECAKLRISAKRMEAANVPERYRHCTIGTYELSDGIYSQSQAAARTAAGVLVELIKANPRRNAQGVLLTGPPGVGKTHLGVSVINELLATAPHLRCLFRDYRELLADIRHSYNPEVCATEWSLLAPVFEADVLVIDELGAERPTEFVLDTVSRILNTRYSRCRTTILTTNYPDLPPSDIENGLAARRSSRCEALGDRITEPMRSRLHEMTRVVELRGEDFRFKRRPEQQPIVRSTGECSTHAMLFEPKTDPERGKVGERK